MKNRLKKGKSWMGRAQDIIQEVCVLEDIEPGEEWSPWPVGSSRACSVIITLNRECRQLNPVSVEAEVQALIFENSSVGDVVIYTDGSVVQHTRSSWAFTAQVGGRTIKEDSGAVAVTTSSLTVEVMAVTKAMAWLETQAFTGVCFLSDSMSMLRKIEKGRFRRHWLASLERSQLAQISFIFVPGHAGVRGNERADWLAGTAAVACGHAMDRADIINALRDAGREKDWNADIESATLTRLREHRVPRGIATHERHGGVLRRMVNQHRTGVVSRYTVRNILRRISECLWTNSSMCNEDDLSTN